MSPSLPQELLDLVIDCLRDDPIALKTCCVVSKPWASRARWHLFADVEFHPVKSPIESWMKAFPDPSNSPARYTRSLSIGVPSLLTSTNTDAHAWLRSFCRVVRLLVFKAVWTDDRPVSLTQLHGFSPILESLSLQYPSASPSGFLNLAVSFLSLKDLFLVSLAEGDADDGWSIPSTSPKFTGALVLITRDWIHPYARRLLDLPGGLHFSSVSILCSDRDAESTARLVSRCSDTIESLFIYYDFSGTSTKPPPLNLTDATRLKNVELRWDTPVQWITRTLQTAKSQCLRRVTIFAPPSFTNPAQGTLHQEWEELDHVLVQLWTSRSIRPKFKYKETSESDDMGTKLRDLLPELTRRGIIDVVGVKD